MMGRSPAVVAEREVRERGACTGGHGAWGGGVGFDGRGSSYSGEVLRLGIEVAAK